MPPLELDENQSHYQIRSYRPGMIQVNNKMLTTSIIILPDHLIENWTPQCIKELTAESLQTVVSFKPDILLIGTGSSLIFLPTAIYGDLINHHIGVELMDTRAACRTYNVLSAENRKVAAALVIS